MVAYTYSKKYLLLALEAPTLSENWTTIYTREFSCRLWNMLLLAVVYRIFVFSLVRPSVALEVVVPFF